MTARSAKGAVLTLLLVVGGSMAGMSAGSTLNPLTSRASAIVRRAEPVVATAELQMALTRANRELRAARAARAASAAPARPLVGRFVVTCYALRGETATGRRVSTDVVAVDPRVVPLGARLYIAGVGVRTAADTGRAIKGSRLDIWMPTSRECRQFGRRPLAVYRA